MIHDHCRYVIEHVRGKKGATPGFNMSQPIKNKHSYNNKNNKDPEYLGARAYDICIFWDRAAFLDLCRYRTAMVSCTWQAAGTKAAGQALLAQSGRKAWLSCLFYWVYWLTDIVFGGKLQLTSAALFHISCRNGGVYPCYPTHSEKAQATNCAKPCRAYVVRTDMNWHRVMSNPT